MLKQTVISLFLITLFYSSVAQVDSSAHSVPPPLVIDTVFLPTDTVHESNTLTVVVEEEYELGYDIGLKISPSLLYFNQSEFPVIEHTPTMGFSTFLYGGFYKNSFGIYTGVGFISMPREYTQTQTIFKTNTYKKAYLDTITTYKTGPENAVVEVPITKLKVKEVTDTIYTDSAFVTKETLSCIQIPLQANYFFPLEGFDVYGGIGIECLLPLKNSFSAQPSILFKAEWGARFYLTDNLGIETSFNLKKGKIQSSSIGPWHKTSFFSASVDFSISRYL